MRIQSVGGKDTFDDNSVFGHGKPNYSWQTSTGSFTALVCLHDDTRGCMTRCLSLGGIAIWVLAMEKCPIYWTTLSPLLKPQHEHPGFENYFLAFFLTSTSAPYRVCERSMQRRGCHASAKWQCSADESSVAPPVKLSIISNSWLVFMQVFSLFMKRKYSGHFLMHF